MTTHRRVGPPWTGVAFLLMMMTAACGGQVGFDGHGGAGGSGGAPGGRPTPVQVSFHLEPTVKKH